MQEWSERLAATRRDEPDSIAKGNCVHLGVGEADAGMLELWAPELNGLVGLPVEWSTSNTHASESVRHVGSLDDPKLVCEGKGMRPPKITMLLLPCGAAVCAQRAPGDS